MNYKRHFLRALCLNWKYLQLYLPKTFGQDWLLLMQLFTWMPGPCTKKWEEKHWAANWRVIKKPELKNQKLLRNNHGKRSVVCKIFISSIKEEGLHHLSKELPISIKQDGSSYTHIFGEEGKEGEGEQRALPQPATVKTSCWKLFCTPSETKRGKTKQTPNLRARVAI